MVCVKGCVSVGGGVGVCVCVWGGWVGPWPAPHTTAWLHIEYKHVRVRVFI